MPPSRRRRARSTLAFASLAFSSRAQQSAAFVAVGGVSLPRPRPPPPPTSLTGREVGTAPMMATPSSADPEAAPAASDAAPQAGPGRRVPAPDAPAPGPSVGGGAEKRPNKPRVPSGRRWNTGRRWKTRRQLGAFVHPPDRSVTPAEEDALKVQLGYVPPNVRRVSARSGDVPPPDGGDAATLPDPAEGVDTTDGKAPGRPVAICSYPLLVQARPDRSAGDEDGSDGGEDEEDAPVDVHDGHDVTPFPTMYWLTCPHASKAVSELERSGHVSHFQDRLEADPRLAERWHGTHEGYAARRWESLSEEDRSWLTTDGREGMLEIVRRSGIGGADHRGIRRNEDGDVKFKVPGVKCLHGHYAHYRSQVAGGVGDGEVNLVGKWTHELLCEKFPDLVL